MINDLGVHPEKCDLGVRLKLAKVGPDEFQPIKRTGTHLAHQRSSLRSTCKPVTLRTSVSIVSIKGDPVNSRATPVNSIGSPTMGLVRIVAFE